MLYYCGSRMQSILLHLWGDDRLNLRKWLFARNDIVQNYNDGNDQ